MKSLPSQLKNPRYLAMVFILPAILLTATAGRAAVPIEIHAFPGPDFLPNGLVQGANGNFYGTMHQTGPVSYGGIYELSTNGSVTNLVTFGSTNGADPKSRLILASDGNFYGVTETGGTNNAGTVFQLTQSGILTTLAQFNSNNPALSGESPFGELMQGSDGNFYGTTEAGGTSHTGTVSRSRCQAR
jgi:uncharacterized repeat protein (TIGR03803 family)